MHLFAFALSFVLTICFLIPLLGVLFTLLFTGDLIDRPLDGIFLLAFAIGLILAIVSLFRFGLRRYTAVSVNSDSIRNENQFSESAPWQFYKFDVDAPFLKIDFRFLSLAGYMLIFASAVLASLACIFLFLLEDWFPALTDFFTEHFVGKRIGVFLGILVFGCTFLGGKRILSKMGTSIFIDRNN